MKGFYVDLKRGAKFALLAGPFKSEKIARKYEAPAVKLAHKLDAWSHFDPYGVVSIESEDPLPVGKLNAQLEIDPADLIQLEEAN